MAGFSLGWGVGSSGSNINNQQQQENPPNQIPPENPFLYRNNDEINKDFELWQLHHHHHRHHHHQRLQDNIYSESDELSWRGNPAAAAAATGGGGGGRRGEEGIVSVSTAMRQGIGGGGMSCQDCGNQAKKDCIHMRCRTCCKSRGFQCPTHVKSTWVPASRRRERQQQLGPIQQQQQQQHHHHHQQQQQQQLLRGENPKRQRESLACTRLPTTTSGMEVGNFPAEVSSAAVFRCVRVSSIDDADDQYAYQTAVNIAGHVFKGVLYDQGPDVLYGPGESSSGGGVGGGGAPPRNLLTSGATTTGATTSRSAAAAAAAAMLDPSSLYPTPLNAFMAGTQFFPPPRS